MMSTLAGTLQTPVTLLSHLLQVGLPFAAPCLVTRYLVFTMKEMGR